MITSGTKEMFMGNLRGLLLMVTDIQVFVKRIADKF